MVNSFLQYFYLHHAFTVISTWEDKWVDGFWSLKNKLNSFIGGTKYFLKKWSWPQLQAFWIVKGSKNSNIVLTVEETFNSTFPLVVTEANMSIRMGL